LLPQEDVRAESISSFREGLDNFMDNMLKKRCYREEAVMCLLISPVQQLWMLGVGAVGGEQSAERSQANTFSLPSLS